MNRTAHICLALLLLPACGLAAQGGPSPARGGPSPVRKQAPPKAMPKMPGKLANPANPLLRLLRMSPEQRDRALEQLPPVQQARVRQALENFDKLPPEVKARRLHQLQVFASLSPREQQTLRLHINAFNELPDDRRAVLRQEVLRLHRMPEDKRIARLESGDFKSRYSAAEQEMLADLSANYPFPEPARPPLAER